ncbi:GNAT family N-acetyltransferase [Streptomyces iconiensis]|uniref:GNAT family N-acetyltransferase n=1 Tax=Streptomyces iconiensis TaxID=1384038 RepID=A0ABT6ZTE4_9ACTN|nr:GNAT family N-acetyltransferase [Streptomyces iconiensis]MDJ1132321.1 GNAT family N-acetyltransferase [Streptomyces iconiensis]
MTTTLRPTGPEHRADDGVRSRTYKICVNSRPVGAVRLVCDPRSGQPVGRMGGLTVDEGERRRGRGTVAALAAEEILRNWGCSRVETSVPLDPEAGEEAGHAAPHLLDALGYQERNRNMVKPLSERPDLPPGSTVRAMTDAEFPDWWTHGRDTFVREQMARGFTREQAGAKMEATRFAQLPDGASTPDTSLLTLTHAGDDVGTVWISYRNLPRTDVDAWIFDIEVREERRGEGHGRAMMLAAERECLDAGKPCLGLNVFTDNPRAQRLYTSLGYRTVERFYAKPLL